ncbi:MAG TPA: hypothetical protein VMU26_00740 [Candidatus Polarisedimenticolia bacterium]|nr:hypothetical protein [Candidatus Polarisedimenticolia bacterium]
MDEQIRKRVSQRRMKHAAKVQEKIGLVELWMQFRHVRCQQRWIVESDLVTVIEGGRCRGGKLLMEALAAMEQRHQLEVRKIWDPDAEAPVKLLGLNYRKFGTFDQDDKSKHEVEATSVATTDDR